MLDEFQRVINISKQQILVVSVDMQFWDKFEKSHGQKNTVDTVCSKKSKCTQLPSLSRKLYADDYYNADK
jgi:hypothetical protein